MGTRKSILRRVLVFGATFAAVGLLTVVMTTGQTYAMPAGGEGEGEGEVECTVWTTLVAGQYTDVGTVTVTLANDVLTVVYETTGNWYMTETHLAVAATVLGIPQTKSGNPKVGHFAQQTYHDPEVQTYTYLIPWVEGSPVFIAAHAVVQENIEGTVWSEETAWGEGDPFGKNWSMYFLLECLY